MRKKQEKVKIFVGRNTFHCIWPMTSDTLPTLWIKCLKGRSYKPSTVQNHKMHVDLSIMLSDSPRVKDASMHSCRVKAMLRLQSV